MRFLSVKRCDLMRKTSEAVVFSALVLFALVIPVCILLTMVEAGVARSFVQLYLRIQSFNLKPCLSVLLFPRLYKITGIFYVQYIILLLSMISLSPAMLRKSQKIAG